MPYIVDNGKLINHTKVSTKTLTEKLSRIQNSKEFVPPYFIKALQRESEKRKI